MIQGRLFFITCFVLATLQIQAQNTYDATKDYLVWKQDFALTWESYKGEPDNSLTSEYQALTYVSFLPVGKTQDAKVVCVFDAKSSWTTTQSGSLLNHHQVHFDLGEVYARRIRRDLQALLTEGNLNERTQLETVEKNYELYSEEFNQYNDETSHGIDKAQQQVWLRKVTNALRQLSEYKID